MSKALYRYQKKHYTRVTVRRELYGRLRRLADELNVTVPDLIRILLEHYERSRGAPGA